MIPSQPEENLHIGSVRASMTAESTVPLPFAFVKSDRHSSMVDNISRNCFRNAYIDTRSRMNSLSALVPVLLQEGIVEWLAMSLRRMPPPQVFHPVVLTHAEDSSALLGLLVVSKTAHQRMTPGGMQRKQPREICQALWNQAT